ncbi:unnamed protein product [Pedinophyceae sp. YPF-701]|nr:unnamed protein product [Pedinophyceae sp. YPF-701]
MAESAPRYNASNAAVKRIMQEVREVQKEGGSDFMAEALESNLFEWVFAVRGPAEGGFTGGLYLGRISLPPEYPMKPPSFIFATPNGRFAVGQKICLSISSHHPEEWQPSWGVCTAMVALRAFFATPGNGALGSLDASETDRAELAADSRMQPPRMPSAEMQEIADRLHAAMLAAEAAELQRRMQQQQQQQGGARPQSSQTERDAGAGDAAAASAAPPPDTAAPVGEVAAATPPATAGGVSAAPRDEDGERATPRASDTAERGEGSQGPSPAAAPAGPSESDSGAKDPPIQFVRQRDATGPRAPGTSGAMRPREPEPATPSAPAAAPHADATPRTPSTQTPPPATPDPAPAAAPAPPAAAARQPTPAAAPSDPVDTALAVLSYLIAAAMVVLLVRILLRAAVQVDTREAAGHSEL